MRWLLVVVLLLVSPRLAVPPPAPVALEPSEDKCSAWVLWDEARGEPIKGARAVLDVIHTRMRKHSSTACEVVKKRYQFQGYRPGVFQEVPVEALTRYEAVRKMRPVMPGCEYFHAVYVRPTWRYKMTRCGQVGKHIFYKLPTGNTTKEKHHGR